MEPLGKEGGLAPAGWVRFKFVIIFSQEASLTFRIGNLESEMLYESSHPK